MNKSVLIGLLVIIVCGITSCTIEKRQHRSGYYINSFQSHDRIIPVCDTAVENSTVDNTNRESSQNKLQQETKAEPVVQSATQPEQLTTTEETEVQVVPKQEATTAPSEKTTSSAPKIEKDKKQATGAGIAAAIFFLLGMAGLVIKGTSGAVGIFIGAAFVCFILCVILASFLYPREPVVKQPKQEMSDAEHTALGISFAILMAMILGLLTIFGLILGIFFSFLF